MLFRINHENFIYYMIDYFTKEELESLQYAIVSASILNRATAENVARFNFLYPSSEIISNYVQLENRKLLYKEYYRELKLLENDIYTCIIQPILVNRHNYVLLCNEQEDVYIDILCDFLYKEFNMPTVDLNRLFKEGKTDIHLIDRDEVKNRTVELKRSAVKRMVEGLEQSKDGRAKLLQMMSKEDKIKKLKELGISVSKSDKKHLDELLNNAWVSPGD